jgi:N-acetyl-gamma-glutamyl-phosphate reductase
VTTEVITMPQKKKTAARTARTAVSGVSGYVGGELARLLLGHPKLKDTKPKFLGRISEDGVAGTSTTLAELQPQLAGIGGEFEIEQFDWKQLVDAGIELLFLATPHEQSREWVPEAMAHGLRVVDLSGAWRLQSDENRSVYKLIDANPSTAAALQAEAVYGCPELHAQEIADARLVANPGCYATSIILALAPLVRAGVVDLEHGIVCDAKSGVSGAGKAATAKTHFMYAADNFSAYAVFGHRHTGEMLEQLGLTTEQIQFTPHLLPIPRGILSTIYLRLKKKSSAEEIETLLRNFYSGSQLVRIRAAGNLPQIRYVVRTNFCDIGVELASDGKRLVMVSCLDNLLKGAAGQAVQNMNLMFGWDETEGLL